MKKPVPDQTSDAPTPAEEIGTGADEAYESGSVRIVGVGASAGGLEAFSQLLAALPVDTGMAFVLVQHLAPSHASALAEILSRVTKMPVAEVQGDSSVEPNHVYVIPPGQSLVVAEGTLQLLPRQGHEIHRPIDQFFRSLAQDRQDLAIGVILSGTATDGTLGLEEIKAGGGTTFAQDASAQHQGMPQSAIASGCVDFVLPAAEIAGELDRISRQPHAGLERVVLAGDDLRGLAEIIQLLHDATGVDFSHYKRMTLHRRILRRMVRSKIVGLRAYAEHLRQTPDEVAALFQDVLIDVTSFFRDPASFEVVRETVLPRLLAPRSRTDPVRIWTIGCSTGQEAYSLAILFTEAAEAAGSSATLQLFATDLNPVSIQKARAGVYSPDIAHDVSAERLRRFFTEVDGGYRINKSIRRACLFSRHDVLTEPPFSRIDLVSCRNVLIYLEPVLQRRIIPMVHYALKPGGYLWLGGSETIGAHRSLFDTADVKHRIFTKRAGSGPGQPNAPHQQSSARKVPSIRITARPDDAADLPREADRVLLSRFAPPGVLVAANLEILQYRGDTSPYLAPAAGKASLSLFKNVREGLIVAVRAAILRAGTTKEVVREEGLRVKRSGGYHDATIEVIPLAGRGDDMDGGFLVLFETPASAGVDPSPSAAHPPPPTGLDNRRLERELVATRDYLQSLIEQQETANEERQAADEEVQSANEELQSTNEELETSKEEIQASNDELSSRNAELHGINADLHNLFSTVPVPVVMLSSDLRVRRFTPMAETILNLIPGDLGRKLADIRFNLDGLPEMEPLLARVRDSGRDEGHEVRDKWGRWYSLRVSPYRTLGHDIDGVIVTLIDIDLIKREQAYTESIVATVHEPLVVLDREFRVRSASPAFYETFGGSPQVTVGQVFHQLDDQQWDIPELRRLLTAVIERGEDFTAFEVEHEFAHLGKRTMVLNARRLVETEAAKPSILLAIEDITERKKIDSALRMSETLLRGQATELLDLDRRKDEFLAMLSHELRNPLAPIANAVRLLGREAAHENPRQAQAREIIERQLGHLQHLVDDLLDVSRVTSGRLQLRRARVAISEIVGHSVETVRPQIEQLRHQLTLSVPPGPIWLDADAARLEQVVTNLLTNAAKFTDQDGHIWLTVALEGEQCVLRVRDSGVGIAPELLPRVFDLFTQAERSLDRSQGGLGIGLALVKRLTALHGGTVEVSSTLGQGSEFIVRLPVAPAETPRLPSSDPTMAPATARPLRIVVVDDNVDTVRTFSMLLKAEGHDVHTAFDGPTAIEAVLEHRPDVVLLDIGLPGLSGYEVASRLRREPTLANTMLVALTGYGLDTDLQKALQAGFHHRLVKPVDFRKLEKVLASATARER